MTVLTMPQDRRKIFDYLMQYQNYEISVEVLNSVCPLTAQKEFWKFNLELARSLWTQVPVNEVSKNLRLWSCGTQACFGGHLGTWPKFQELGIKSSPADGSPIADTDARNNPWNLPWVLFGAGGLFCPAEKTEEGTDHEIVLNRIEVALKGL